MGTRILTAMTDDRPTVHGTSLSALTLTWRGVDYPVRFLGPPERLRGRARRARRSRDLRDARPTRRRGCKTIAGRAPFTSQLPDVSQAPGSILGMSSQPVIRGPLDGAHLTWDGRTFVVRFLGPTAGYVVELEGQQVAGPFGTIADVRSQFPDVWASYDADE